MTQSTFVLPEAQRDIREAALWYERREISLGLRFVGEVRSSISFIEQNPLRFPIVEQDIRRALLKSFPYSIYFKKDMWCALISGSPFFLTIDDLRNVWLDRRLKR